MADSKPKNWLEDLDQKMSKNQRTKLAHEANAGARCLSCEYCPGLELHFWRKVCKVCKCTESSHDIESDDATRFGLVLTKPELIVKNTQQTRSFMIDAEDLRVAPMLFKQEGATCAPGDRLEFDWIPPDLDKDGILEYMSEMPKHHAPVANTKGALGRKVRWQHQIPEHDLNPQASMQKEVQNNNIKRYTDYINTVKARAVGQAEVIRLKKTDRSESETYETAKPQLVTQFLNQHNRNLLKENPDGSGEVKIDPETGKAVGYASPDCYSCQTAIDIWNIAVYVEKEGRHFFFHPACFKCASCKNLLVDLLFFYHKEMFYCLRDYAKARNIARCASCDELIFNNQWTNANGDDYHLEHFLCFQCEKPLADEDYVNEKNQPYCIPCFETYVAKTCNTCQNTIGPREASCSLKNLTWHCRPECFRCARCFNPLPLDSDTQYVVFDSNETPTQTFCSIDCKHKAAALV